MREGRTPLLAILLLLAALVLLLASGQGPVLGLDPDGFAALARGSALVLFLSSGILYLVRTDMAGALKSLAIWAAAFVALIALYAYGPELGQARDRVLSVLVPGRAVEMSGSDGRQVLVQRARDDHFQVDGEIEGRATRFMVDTGASAIAMDARTAARLGIEPPRGGYTARVLTGNGVARAAPVTLSSVRIGPIERRNVAALVTEGEGLGTVLLGMSFLNTLTSYDFRGDRLVLTD